MKAREACLASGGQWRPAITHPGSPGVIPGVPCQTQPPQAACNAINASLGSNEYNNGGRGPFFAYESDENGFNFTGEGAHTQEGSCPRYTSWCNCSVVP